MIRQPGTTQAFIAAMIRRAMLGFVLLIGLEFAIFELVALDTRYIEATASLVNQSAAQRVRSERIALMAEQLALREDPASRSNLARMLEDAVSEMRDTHERLSRPAAGSPAARHLTPRVVSVYRDDPWNLDAELASYLEAAEAVSRQSGPMPDSPELLRVRTTYESGVLASLLDLAVHEYEKDSAARSGRLHRISRGALATTLAVIIGLALLVFRPFVVRVRGEVEDLETLSEALEERVADRSRELNERANELARINEELGQSMTALQASEERFQQIAANIDEIFWLADSDQGRLLYVSPAYETIFQQDRSILQRNPLAWWDWVHPDDRDYVDEMYSRLGEGAVDYDYRIDRPDGQIRWLRNRVVPVSEGPGAGRLVVGITQDVTEAEQLQSQLVEAQKLESIGQLAAGIAHEINTPAQFVADNVKFLGQSFEEMRPLLERIMGLGKLHLEGVALATELEKLRGESEEAELDFLLEEMPGAIAQSEDGIRRISEIVRAMKEFSHPGTTDKTAVDLNAAIQSTVTVARNEWKYVASVELELADDLPLVICLPGELNQVVLNMLVNAAHAIEETPGRSGKGRITLRTRVAAPWVEIEVEDDGPGIPEEIRSKVFDPFFTTKEVGKGTGQGLAIARSVIVDKHQGELTFRSAPGDGTTFLIRIPLEPSDH